MALATSIPGKEGGGGGGGRAPGEGTVEWTLTFTPNNETKVLTRSVENSEL